MANLFGTNPNQVPLNSMLGNLAFQDKAYVSVDKVGIGTTFVDSGTAGQILQVYGGGAYVSGSVGIGTTNPGEKLQVDGNLRLGGSATSNYIAFYGTTGDNPGQYNHTYIGERLWGGTESSELFLFKGNDFNTGSGPDRIRLAAGQIRIDTFTTPLSGTFENIGISGNLINRIVVHPTGEVGIGSDVLTGTASQLLQVNSGAYFNGNIGIGTTNPQGSIHIYRQNTTQFLETHTDFILENPGKGNARFFLKTRDNNRNWEFFADDDDGSFGIYDGIGAARRFSILPTGNVLIGTSSTTGTGTTTQSLQVTGGAYVSGSIGIGTTNPQTKLQINGVLGFGTFTAFSQTVTNVRIGDNTTGAAITNGYNNFLIGVGAGKSITSGAENIFVGAGAGRSSTDAYSNVVMGLLAGGGGSIGAYNNIIGETAGYLNSGNYNNIFGFESGYNNQGVDNVFIGKNAGYTNLTGGQNVFIGLFAGYQNTTGFSNVFIGEYAGYGVTTGANNIVMGYNTLPGAGQASYNVVLGYTAGSSLTSGNGNIFFGNSAADNQISGDNNVAIGNGVRLPKTNSGYQLAIGIKSDVTATKYWIVGNENFNVGVGTTNPAYKLDVAGDINFTGTFYQNSSPFVASRWTAGTGNNIYRLDGSVGIGTTDPVSVLETQENTTSTTNLTITNSNTGSNVTKASRIRFRLTDTVGTRKDVAYITAYPNDSNSALGDYLSFHTRTLDSTPTEKMRLDNNGNLVLGSSFTVTGTASQLLQVTGGAYVSSNLGVGATNPNARLEVNNGSNPDANPELRLSGVGYIDLHNNLSAGAYNPFTSLGDKGIIFTNGTGTEPAIPTGNFIIAPWSSTSGGIKINSFGELLVSASSRTGTASQPLQVTGGTYVSGNLGVGNTNPLSKLSVTGDGSFTGVVTATTFIGNLTNTVTGSNTTEIVRGNMADNDQFRILIGGTTTNAGYAELATADDGTEPIYVRQYTGVFSTLVRTLTLLDGSGNTSIPGSLTVTGNISGPTSVNGTAFEAYELDDISPLTNGTENTFIPKFNYEKVTLTNPFGILITINGILQSAFINNTDYVFQSNFLGSNNGYTLDSDSNIKFTESIPSGSDIIARVIPSASTPTRIKYYPFKPTDILLGY